MINEIGGIDYGTALAQFGSDENFVSILKTMVAKTPPVLDMLRNPNADNLPTFLIAVHGLKGSLNGIFAKEAGDAAEELEKLSKAGNLEAVKAKTPEFIMLCEELIAAINKLPQINAASSGVENRELKYAPDGGLLNKLENAAGRFKTHEIEKLIGELAKFRYETGGDLIEWLAEQSENLEYGAITEKLAAIRASQIYDCGT
jgi:HPt (histidine-containing phosphotransfer) domain-containing protein